MKKCRFISILLIFCLLLTACGSKISNNTSKEDDRTDLSALEAKPSASDGVEPSVSDQLPEHLMTAPDLSDELLILVNKTHSLAEDDVPEDLVVIDRFVAGVGSDETHQMRAVAAEALNKMFDDAANAGIELRLRTGYRSYSYQSTLYKSYVERHGQAKADTFSARPGQSEHQTGLCCDLGGKSEDFALSYDFGKTPEGKWVEEHAHEYGFIIRYIDGDRNAQTPGEITGYVFEPWHIRYVGTEHAAAIKAKGETLEEYLGILN